MCKTLKKINCRQITYLKQPNCSNMLRIILRNIFVVNNNSMSQITVKCYKITILIFPVKFDAKLMAKW